MALPARKSCSRPSRLRDLLGPRRRADPHGPRAFGRMTRSICFVAQTANPQAAKRQSIPVERDRAFNQLTHAHRTTTPLIAAQVPERDRMKKEMLINVKQPEECRIAIVEDGVLEELYVERTSHESYTGNIYKGRIVNLEPAIQAAFVDFSVGRNGFLHVSDIESQYFERGPVRPGRRPSRPPRERDRDRRRDPRREGDRNRGRDPRRRPPAPEPEDTSFGPHRRTPRIEPPRIEPPRIERIASTRHRGSIPGRPRRPSSAIATETAIALANGNAPISPSRAAAIAPNRRRGASAKDWSRSPSPGPSPSPAPSSRSRSSPSSRSSSTFREPPARQCPEAPESGWPDRAADVPRPYRSRPAAEPSLAGPPNAACEPEPFQRALGSGIDRPRAARALRSRLAAQPHPAQRPPARTRLNRPGPEWGPHPARRARADGPEECEWPERRTSDLENDSSAGRRAQKRPRARPLAGSTASVPPEDFSPEREPVRDPESHPASSQNRRAPARSGQSPLIDQPPRRARRPRRHSLSRRRSGPAAGRPSPRPNPDPAPPGRGHAAPSELESDRGRPRRPNAPAEPKTAGQLTRARTRS